MDKFKFSDRYDRVDGGEISLNIIGKYQGGDDVLPFYWWSIAVGGKAVGKISLRVGDAKSGVNYFFNGNIGYEVDEPYRGHNYAEKAARLLIPIAKEHCMSELILTCDESNAASYKSIENLGGELLEISEAPQEYFAWQQGMELQRIYRIEVK